MQPLTLTVDETVRVLNLPRTRVFGLLKTGELESFRIGNRRLVKVASVEAFVAHAGSAAADR